MNLLHYTNDDGHKAITSQIIWTFKALQPPGNHRAGAYFTTLRHDAPRFSARTRVPKEKQAFVLCFDGMDGLQPMEGGRGAYIFWSPQDYLVEYPRQRYHGSKEDLP